jgi:hypothetical protein
LAESGKLALLTFLGSIHSASTKKVPDDGTVHELAVNTMNIISAVNDYAEVSITIIGLSELRVFHLRQHIIVSLIFLIVPAESPVCTFLACYFSQ